MRSWGVMVDHEGAHVGRATVTGRYGLAASLGASVGFAVGAPPATWELGIPVGALGTEVWLEEGDEVYARATNSVWVYLWLVEPARP